MVVGPEAQDPYRVNSWLSIVSERVFRHDLYWMNTLWFWCLRLPVCLVHRVASLKFPRGLRTSHRTLCEALWMFPFNVVENPKSLCMWSSVCVQFWFWFSSRTHFYTNWIHKTNQVDLWTASYIVLVLYSHSYVPKSTFIQYGGKQLTEVMLNRCFVSRVLEELADKQSRTRFRNNVVHFVWPILLPSVSRLT